MAVGNVLLRPSFPFDISGEKGTGKRYMGVYLLLYFLHKTNDSPLPWHLSFLKLSTTHLMGRSPFCLTKTMDGVDHVCSSLWYGEMPVVVDIVQVWYLRKKSWASFLWVCSSPNHERCSQWGDFTVSRHARNSRAKHAMVPVFPNVQGSSHPSRSILSLHTQQWLHINSWRVLFCSSASLKKQMGPRLPPLGVKRK